MNLEEYLIGKKIDPPTFREKEPALWKAWSSEFEQMHPNSFTVQKLNLINPIRRKYPLKLAPVKAEGSISTPTTSASAVPGNDAKPIQQPPANPKPSVPKPVFKPKPKMQ